MAASTVPDEREWIDDAVKVLGRENRLCPSASSEWPHNPERVSATRHRRTNLLRQEKMSAHLAVSELRRLRQMEEANARIKRLVTYLSLDKHMLWEALKKVTCPHAAENWLVGFKIPSASVACRPVGWRNSAAPRRIVAVGS